MRRNKSPKVPPSLPKLLPCKNLTAKSISDFTLFRMTPMITMHIFLLQLISVMSRPVNPGPRMIVGPHRSLFQKLTEYLNTGIVKCTMGYLHSFVSKFSASISRSKKLSADFASPYTLLVCLSMLP